MKSLYWFTQDLRLTDNPAFTQAVEATNKLHCVFIHDRASFARMGLPRQGFLTASVNELGERLNERGLALEQLHIYPPEGEHSTAGGIAQALNDYCRSHGITQVHVSAQAGSYERDAINALEAEVTEHFNQTLWAEAELPCELSALPSSFSKARKLWEKSQRAMGELTANALNESQRDTLHALKKLPHHSPVLQFIGGEQAGLEHVAGYFRTDSARFYKQTRNALDGWTKSTRFSPWLALGCISPRQVVAALRRYEFENGANESTYWIFFELLWREYFFWYGRLHRDKLFIKNGLKDEPAYQSQDDAESFARWQQGQTEFPLVNACMKQLNQTGYISNRGRQLVASCLVNELHLDWRLGANYFEQQLIDYNVASNWGNWQYLGGVGADPRGLRRFDQDKQQRQYDPYGEFIKRWQGYVS